MLRVWMSYLFATLIALQSVLAIADSHQEHQQQSVHLELSQAPDSSLHQHAGGLSHQDSFSFSGQHQDHGQENEAAHPDCHHGHCHHPVQVFLALQTDKLKLAVTSQQLAETTSSYLSALLPQDQRPPIA
ncbi:hypothetical protein [Thalassomonas actiniarum]|uniref:DUF2946 domain-containing protein n=1 Tax=Thalassomonas actiniarum TaxID=485447 RepID=A0AAE9YTJ3_9GAMM|nr:hypothetical protein [Thalassomonas actiniarum]WDD99227.1 hypothetical protein SG35_000620 [Thalassomonas actiniarum]